MLRRMKGRDYAWGEMRSECEGYMLNYVRNEDNMETMGEHIICQWEGK